MKKKKAEMSHLKRRWIQRVGQQMTKALHDSIVGQIRSGKSTIINKTSNRVTIHRVSLEANSYRVVYDKQRKQVITVLPLKEKL